MTATLRPGDHVIVTRHDMAPISGTVIAAPPHGAVLVRCDKCRRAYDCPGHEWPRLNVTRVEVAA